MDALIIAAGFGSRLAELSPSKPLTPVAGVPLIEIGIRQAMLAGITRVVVVTDTMPTCSKLSRRPFAAGRGGNCAVRLTNWSTPNGYSVMAGATRCDGNYLLMMADHMSTPIFWRASCWKTSPAVA